MFKRSLKTIFVAAFFISCQSSQKFLKNYGPIKSQFAKSEPSKYKAIGSRVAIATQGIHTTEIAQEIYNNGGNLIDAFVAASFAVSVERPQSTGIGGGGFLVYHDGKSKKEYILDFRERAPEKATSGMYLDKNGDYLSDLSKNGSLAVSIPGLVKGLKEIHNKFGKLPWEKVVEPSIKLAESGFVVYPYLADALKSQEDVLAKFPDSKKIFFNTKNQVLKLGDRLIQKDLAHTLKKIAKNGADEFYLGSTSKLIIDSIKRHNGILNAQDLKNYTTIQRQPVVASFRNYKIVSMPPPSSGGIHVIQFLKFMNNKDWNINQITSAEVIHSQASSFQMAFADRARYLGDPDFVKVPTEKLISDSYIESRKKEIQDNKARSADKVSFGALDLPSESSQTTHLSLIDSDGNAISSTQTINGWFGSGVVAEGTGIVLNNEMDDFSAKTGTSNMFGAVGSDANSISPMKTPLSSMSPTLVFDDKNMPIMAVGAPGGTRIISCTALTIFNYLHFNMSLDDAITQIRIHHQWKPDTLFLESPGPIQSEKEKLEKMGYKIELGPIPCRVMAVAKSHNGQTFESVADPRDIGTAYAK